MLWYVASSWGKVRLMLLITDAYSLFLEEVLPTAAVYRVDWGWRWRMLLVTCDCYLCWRHGNVGSRVTAPPVPARDTWHVSGVTQCHAVTRRSQARRAGTWAPGTGTVRHGTSGESLHCHHQPPEPRVLVLCLCFSSRDDASSLILSPIHKSITSIQCFSEWKCSVVTLPSKVFVNVYCWLIVFYVLFTSAAKWRYFWSQPLK